MRHERRTKLVLRRVLLVFCLLEDLIIKDGLGRWHLVRLRLFLRFGLGLGLDLGLDFLLEGGLLLDLGVRLLDRLLLDLGLLEGLRLLYLLGLGLELRLKLRLAFRCRLERKLLLGLIRRLCLGLERRLAILVSLDLGNCLGSVLMDGLGGLLFHHARTHHPGRHAFKRSVLRLRLGRALLLGRLAALRRELSQDCASFVTLDHVLADRRHWRGRNREALHQADQPVDRGVDVRRRVATARIGPLKDPYRARKRTDDQHVVRAGELDLVRAALVLDGKRAPAGDVSRNVALGEDLDRHVLEEVRDLGVSHHVLEGLARIAQARVFDDVRHEPIDARRALEVLARHERRRHGHLHARCEVLRADFDLLDVDELCHGNLPLRPVPYA